MSRWFTRALLSELLPTKRERFLQKSHLITCFRRFTNAPNHLAVYVPILGQVDWVSQWFTRVLLSELLPSYQEREREQKQGKKISVAFELFFLSFEALRFSVLCPFNPPLLL